MFLYYLSWLVFGAVGLLLNLVCMGLLLLPGRRSLETPVRRTIRRLFAAWIAWLHATRVVEVSVRGFDENPPQTGTVYIANHPTLIDATVILAHLPDAVCIFKPSLMRNPAVGPAALMAGYVSGDTGLDLIKEVAAKVAAGQSLLVFPEGTRTAPGTHLGRLKPGFALIADRARAPVRLITVKASAELCTRGRPLWPAPSILPGRIEIALHGSWQYEPGRSAAELAAEVESTICGLLADS